MKVCKRAVSIFLTLAILISAIVINGVVSYSAGNLWKGEIATSFSTGSGTSDDPYIITTAEELAYLSQQVNWGVSYEDCYFELGADIILNDTTDWEEWGTYDEDNNLNAPGNVWTPIGKYSYSSFYGNFDGKGYTVYGAYVNVNNIDADYFGLFGYAGEPNSYGYSDRVTIKNLNVAESYIYGARSDYSHTPNIGGVVGYGDADSCTFNGRVCGDDSYVGGIVGYGDAKHCSNYGTVTGSSAAGIVSHGNAYFCNNFGEIHGYDYAGGIAVDGCAKYCSNSGDIYASVPDAVGGIVANARAYSVDEMTGYCYNSGNITVEGAYYAVIGGVVGNGIVSECYNSGDITLINSEGNNDVGGVVGFLDVDFEVAFSGCYNAGALNLDCSGEIGAVVGDNGEEIEVEGCYYLDSSYPSDEYAVSLTDAEMRVAPSFKNWNFNRMWEYVEGAEYPYPTLRCFGSKKYYYSAVFYNGDGTILKEILAEENEEITFTEPTGVVGKTFCYWENDGVRYSSGDTFVMTEDEAFYAVYERKNTSSKAWDGSVADSFGGNGTEDDPYLITSAAELAYLAESVNSGNRYTGKFFSLTKDIYLNDAVDDYSYFTMGENKWTPIGSDSNNNFNGNFDGKGHTVYGLYIKSSNEYMGLFGYSYSGKINNLNIENSAVFCCFENDNNENDTIYAGLAVGFCYGEIENFSVSGIARVVMNSYEYDSSYRSLYLGGVAGYSHKAASGCVNNADVSLTSVNGSIGSFYGTFYIAGVFGRGVDVTDCVNNGTVSSFGVTTYYSNIRVYLSGVVGRAENINNCTNNGKVCAEEFYLSNFENDSVFVSGISANVEKEANECVNNGDIQGYSSAGGILVSSDGNITVVEDCVNNGRVIGGSVGGIVVSGYGLLRNCENTGELVLVSNLNNNAAIGGIAASGNNAYGCINRGKITIDGVYKNGWYEVGGIFGALNRGDNAGSLNIVAECVSYGDIIYASKEERTSDRILIGGIVGSGYENTLVERSSFKGNITATDVAYGDIGGIIGNGTVADCLFEGNISVSGVPSYDDMYIGGIAGSGTVENSLSLGKVTLEVSEDVSYYDDVFAGAVAGDPETVVTNSFYLYNPDTKDEYKNNSGTKGSSQTLSSKSTYTGWDFNKVWEMKNNLISSYPTLRFIGSKNYLYYLEFEDEGKILSRQLLSGGSSVDLSAPYEKKGYTFAYWEKDGVYYYPDDSHILTEDGVYTAVWIYCNAGEETWDSSVTDTEWQGSGSEDDPYLITSAEELAGLAKRVNESSKNNYEGLFFKQTNDIFLNDAYDYSHTVMAQNTWTPIGKSSSYSFKGNYDGDGHTVYGIYIKSNANYDGKIQTGGLFGYVNNVTIKNLTVDNSYLEHFGKNSYSAVYGGFVGKVYYDSFIKLENCVNKANVHTDYRSGGFVGNVEDNLIITNCSNYGEVSGTTAGGFVGYLDNSMNETEIVVKDSVNYGKVCDLEFIGSYTGGFIGYLYNYYTTMDDLSELVNLENKGEITCKHGYCGGIAGYVYYVDTVENCVNNGKINAVTGGGIFGGVYTYSSVENCTNNSSVFGSDNAGGIVAVSSNSNGSVYISDCENNADIKSEKYAGGIVATGRTYIYDSVNNGSVTGDDSTGGISAESSGTILGCENYGNIFADSHGGGIAGGGTPYVENCANFGNVTATGGNIGGIVGYWPWNSYATIKNCYNSGDIKGVRDVGGILGYDNTQGNGSLSGCYNTGSVSGDSNVGGILGAGTAVNCYNIGDVTGGGNVGGIVGGGTARYSYNKGNVTGENNYVGGISGSGGASNCYNTGTVEGKNDVGGITGYGTSSYCYNIGDVYGKYYVGVISGRKNDSHVNCYYLDSVVISCEDSSSLYYNGTSVDSETLSLGALEGFDFEGTWEVGVIDTYSYPTLKNTTHTVTYTVSFLDKDGTVLKEQQVIKGHSAYPPTIEPFVEGDSVYALDHWEGNYKNVTSNTTVKAVYKKTEIIKFKGINHNLTVPFGLSADNLKVLIESSYSKLLCTTTHDYKMNCDVEWDLSNYNPNASGKYRISGTLTVTRSPYYEMAAGETVSVSVTVLSGEDDEFDQSHLTYSVSDDNTVIITGYTGSAEDIIIPSTLDGHTVSGIADNAFKDNDRIISVYITPSVKTIGQRAFAGCSALVQVTFSEGLVSVGEYAFGDTALTGVTLPQSLETIGEKAFGCYNEKSFVQGFTIYAFEGTIAESFAEQWEINCVVVEKKTDSYTGITVIAEEGVELSVSKVFSGDYFETADSIDERANISLFEIKIYSDTDDELQPGNMMTISVPLPEGFSQGSKVYRINADGSYMDMNARIVDGMLVFNTAHLSYYAIISESSALPGDVDGNGEIDTSDLASLKLHLAGMEVSVSAGADVNGNGEIDASDLAQLKLRLARI